MYWYLVLHIAYTNSHQYTVRAASAHIRYSLFMASMARRSAIEVSSTVGLLLTGNYSQMYFQDGKIAVTDSSGEMPGQQ